MDDSSFWKVMGTIGVIVGVVWLVMASVRESADWEQYKRDHQCVVSREIQGQWTVDGDYVYGQTCWRCDDGVEYCR